MPMTERQIEHNIKLSAEDLSFLFYHTHTSMHSSKGFPDVCIAGPLGSNAPSVLYYEVKTPVRKVTPEQLAWMITLRNAGLVARIVYEHEHLLPGKYPAFEATLGDVYDDLAEAYQRHVEAQ